MDKEKSERLVRKTLYISRRAIWVNILLSILISYVAGYIHTRRWKALGIVVVGTFVFGFLTASENESLEEAVERGITLSPLFGLIGTIDNSLAIRRARQTVANGNVDAPGNQ
ncbi:hypothetical protein [Synechocystis sp. PCC 6803]|nr:hypothetical protein [Synechocystis sp. PCC 6803]